MLFSGFSCGTNKDKFSETKCSLKHCEACNYGSFLKCKLASVMFSTIAATLASRFSVAVLELVDLLFGKGMIWLVSTPEATNTNGKR